MNYINRLFCTILLFFIITSCSKSVTNTVEEEEVIEVTSFTFTSALNSSLKEDLVLVKEQIGFNGKLPSYIGKKLIPTFQSNASRILVNNIEQKSGITELDFSGPVKYVFLGDKGGSKEIIVTLSWTSFEIPQISITIDGEEEVVDKEKYLKATLYIDGNDLYADYSGTTDIRGRGNSTWGYAKKPYRLRLATKSQIFGLSAARNWVLLANYLDPSLMCNTIAMRIGRDLDVPFTNTMIPVDLTINGTYRGAYVLTEHLEVATDRINITDQGYLLEMDDYYDEEFKFKSLSYNLPVMIKGPDLSNQSEVSSIQTDFNSMESLVSASTFPNNGYRERLDIDGFARFLLVNFLVGNEEVNHPKSTYMHKKPGGKYSFGPLWDFDWAYGYESGDGYFTNANREMFWTYSNAQGSYFFQRLMSDPQVKAAFKTHWTNYKQNYMKNLLRYIDEYAALIKASHERNAVRWNISKEVGNEAAKMKLYLNNRMAYIDSYVSSF